MNRFAPTLSKWFLLFPPEIAEKSDSREKSFYVNGEENSTSADEMFVVELPPKPYKWQFLVCWRVGRNAEKSDRSKT